MKTSRLKSAALAAIATLGFAAPMAIASPAAAAPQRYEQRHDQHDNRRDARQDHRNWRRGERASAQDRRYWHQVDYRRNHFRAPPRGYHYVRDDRNGQTLLVGIATGVILSVIASR